MHKKRRTRITTRSNKTNQQKEQQKEQQKRVIRSPFFDLTTYKLRIEMNHGPTHGAIHVVLATRRIIFFILFGMPSPTSTTERMFAIIHNHRTFIFCAMRIYPSIFPRCSALVPVINKHIIVTYGTVIGLGLRPTQFPNGSKPGPSVGKCTHSPVLRKRHRNGR